MPDIALRFHKDMLVLSSPVAVVLARQGFDVEHDLEFANLVEPEAVRDALKPGSVRRLCKASLAHEPEPLALLRGEKQACRRMCWIW